MVVLKKGIFSVKTFWYHGIVQSFWLTINKEKIHFKWHTRFYYGDIIKPVKNSCELQNLVLFSLISKIYDLPYWMLKTLSILPVPPQYWWALPEHFRSQRLFNWYIRSSKPPLHQQSDISTAYFFELTEIPVIKGGVHQQQIKVSYTERPGKSKHI